MPRCVTPALLALAVQAVLLHHVSAESVNSLRVFLEIDDTLPVCTNNWDATELALRYTHIIVRGLGLSGSGASCTVSPPLQRCLTPAKLQELRNVGITVYASFGKGLSSQSMIDCATNTADFHTRIVEAVVPSGGAYAYHGLLIEGAQFALQQGGFITKVRTALPYSADISLGMPSTSLDFANSAAFEPLPALMADAAIRFLVVGYTAVGSAKLDPTGGEHLRQVADLLKRGNHSVVSGVCYGTDPKCLGEEGVLPALLAFQGCAGGIALLGTDNYFRYDRSNATVAQVVTKRRACYIDTTDTTPLQDPEGSARAIFFLPNASSVSGTNITSAGGNSIMPTSMRLDSGSYLSNVTAYALDLARAPRYDHSITPLLPFDPKNPSGTFGYAEEWGCIDTVDNTSCPTNQGTTYTNGVMGYSGASLEFLKIGVGLLSRPASLKDAEYSPTEARYVMLRPLSWRVDRKSDSVLEVSTSDSLGDGSVYGYELKRTYTFTEGTINVKRELKNTGSATLTTAHTVSTLFKADDFPLLPPKADGESDKFYRLRYTKESEASKAKVFGTCTELCSFLDEEGEYFAIKREPVESTVSRVVLGDEVESQNFEVRLSTHVDTSDIVLTRAVKDADKSNIMLLGITAGSITNQALVFRSSVGVKIEKDATVTWSEDIGAVVSFPPPAETKGDAAAIIIAVLIIVASVGAIIYMNMRMEDEHGEGETAPPPAHAAEENSYTRHEMTDPEAGLHSPPTAGEYTGQI